MYVKPPISGAFCLKGANYGRYHSRHSHGRERRRDRHSARLRAGRAPAHGRAVPPGGRAGDERAPVAAARIRRADGGGRRDARPLPVHGKPSAGLVYGRGHGGAPVPRLAGRAHGGAQAALRPRRATGGAGGVHEARLPERPHGPHAGRGGRGYNRRRDRRRGGERRRTALRGGHAEDGRRLRPALRHRGPLRRGAGLSGRGHRAL